MTPDTGQELVELGRIVRLQIQRSSLKVGPERGKRYDPAALHPVDRIIVDSLGASIDGVDGSVLDVHHALHPETKNRGNINPLSIGFTSHYGEIRQQHGEWIEDGIAGENILVESDRVIGLDTVLPGLVIAGNRDRRALFGNVSIAHPCVEFSRFVMGDPDAPAREVSAVLRFLDNGIRGFYVVVSDGRHEIRVGDLVYAVQPL